MLGAALANLTDDRLVARVAGVGIGEGHHRRRPLGLLRCPVFRSGEKPGRRTGRVAEGGSRTKEEVSLVGGLHAELVGDLVEERCFRRSPRTARASPRRLCPPTRGSATGSTRRAPGARSACGRPVA
jgi:hypothetical protein